MSRPHERAGRRPRDPVRLAMLSTAVAAVMLAIASLPSFAQSEDDTGGQVGEERERRLDQAPEEEGLPTLGKELYMRHCAWCHGRNGEGTPFGPPLNGEASAYYWVSTGRMPIPDPGVEPKRQEVPFTEQEVAAIVAYVAAISEGPDLFDVLLANADIGHGAELYLTNCAACHGSAGAGGTLTTGAIPGVLHATPEQIAASMLIGPGTMPTFVPPFTPKEIADIAAYIVELQTSPRRGGAPLGAFGPVSEGFAAWVIAIPLLLLVARWLGESRDLTEGEGDEE